MARSPKQAVETVPDPEKMNPQAPEDFLERGWLYYSLKNFDLAEADFYTVLRNDPGSIDSWYALGLTLKAMGQGARAVDAFSRIDSMLNEIDDHQKAMMVSRLAHGQVNQIKTGDWNLEKEVWKRS